MGLNIWKNEGELPLQYKQSIQVVSPQGPGHNEWIMHLNGLRKSFICIFRPTKKEEMSKTFMTRQFI